MKKIIICGLIFLIFLLIGCTNQEEINKLKQEVSKQADLRCKNVCKSDYKNKYYDGCKESSCRYKMRVGCMDFDYTKFDCKESKANNDGGCKCVCDCGLRKTYTLN